MTLTSPTGPKRSKTQFRTHAAIVSLALGVSVTLPAVVAMIAPTPVIAQEFPAFRQALAEGVGESRALSSFYREIGYTEVWTGAEHAARRSALVSALSRAEEHGLPSARYDLQGLLAAFNAVQTERDRGFVEARASLTFLQYARDISSGVLEPSAVISDIVRDLPRPDPAVLMREFTAAEPVSFIRNLAPSAPEYARLFHAKRELEDTIANGGWGPTVQAGSLQPGQHGSAVVALRNRLIAMGYMPRVATARYDGMMQRAVQEFQVAHGIDPDGVAGSATIREINVAPEERVRNIVVALERERWLNIPRGDRHVWVNLTDFSARVVDFDQVTFQTRSVVGSRANQTPEFSDVMEYLEINPDWTLPRSIVAEYWGALSSGGARHLNMIDGQGNVVPREYVDFARYSPTSLPFNVRQPPGPGNPLGEVKFMFPNAHAIYLHDTPSRSLFGHSVRAYSHGCIRLQDPRDFAYTLLGMQEVDPEAYYQRVLRSRQQTRVSLLTPVPVHLVYRTAFTSVTGRMNYRADIYRRDSRLYDALLRAGVEVGA
ncbi:L,D-transpeptidase family protein [Pararhodobacter oceanensis]|uniref:Murein L,D-transpeptidase n=1 Tax=Pararhodobacter oceanensis TaxID=2172121 RepID=A0A2T8HYN0_9RHOB|nr:L,D-transpeptidase family protein [Pararhodobacter oceanensis]PVH30524.1 murein L,D-transpeptidase [Pararhodobacter oceanensis]